MDIVPRGEGIGVLFILYALPCAGQPLLSLMEDRAAIALALPSALRRNELSAGLYLPWSWRWPTRLIAMLLFLEARRGWVGSLDLVVIEKSPT